MNSLEDLMTLIKPRGGYNKWEIRIRSSAIHINENGGVFTPPFIPNR